MKILFICTGNICRSPLAEGYLRYLAEKDPALAGLEIDSAGTLALTASTPSYESIMVADENGFSIDEQVSQQLNEHLLSSSDYVLVMCENHKKWIKTHFPAYSDKVYLLRTFNGDSEKEIPDPMGMDIDVYRKIFSLIKPSVDNFVRQKLFKK